MDLEQATEAIEAKRHQFERELNSINERLSIVQKRMENTAMLRTVTGTLEWTRLRGEGKSLIRARDSVRRQLKMLG